ncbi:MAG: hypothetical protein KDJ38_16540 [Gammaproteobacteria bacterium]|nr:hypothetical protein [Gammaproteobacteria bacterium]
MSDRVAIAKKLIEMQKKFIAYEQANGLDPKDYYTPAEGHELHGYTESYNAEAMKLLELAHSEKGSRR